MSLKRTVVLGLIQKIFATEDTEATESEESLLDDIGHRSGLQLGVYAIDHPCL